MERQTLIESGLMALRKIHKPMDLPWIPWRWVQRLYPPGNSQDYAALFKAYHRVRSILDIKEIITRLPPQRQGDACRRCGQCCALLLPEPVTDRKMYHWMRSDSPVHLFYSLITSGPRAGRFYTGWYYEGVRLKMCPLLFRDPFTGNDFCAIYHLGPGQRPPGCEGFKPNWPHCEVSQRPLVP